MDLNIINKNNSLCISIKGIEFALFSRHLWIFAISGNGFRGCCAQYGLV